MLHLLPYSLAERRQTGASDSVDDVLYSGFYPRFHGQKLDPRQALDGYFETCAELDVRWIGEIHTLANLHRFVHHCAGCMGQLAIPSSLDVDAGVSHTTASKLFEVSVTLGFITCLNIGG